MDNSILFARYIGPFIVLIGLSIILNFKLYGQIAEGFIKNTALIYITGLITFVAGLAIVLNHNVWVGNWPVIITVLGWISFIKGIWLVAFPGSAGKISAVFIKNIKLVVLPWSVMFIIGIFLVMKGYF